MPLYEYRCAKCGNVFEVLQKLSDEPLKKHPTCGGKVEKLISTSALSFKGTGWYVTDYAKSGSLPKGEAKTESKPESAADSKPSESKATESKSETKTSEKKSESKKPAKAS
jgi:putative FmdB family regulatory protein